MRTSETTAINSKLEIVKLSNQKFKVPGGYVIKKGYALHHPALGFFCWPNPNKDGHILPYTPKGGKATLQEILDTGGFLSFENSIWMMEVNM